MSGYALDSNIISYLLKGNLVVAARIEAAIDDGDEVIIPPIAYYEVKRGLIAVNASEKLRKFEQLCAHNVVGDITRTASDESARVHASLRRKDTVEDADILMAGFCIAGGHTLVTHNVKHFKNIDELALEDWTE